ncbi:potassium channel family protein [Prochlorococcus marinus]|uniref:potassium channel family protein n=1 Tax=Prochlorococcus marinus TaxID=1219 RepID=UPI00030A022C|nr:potassium channel family protein [Prochlorococcus marinus]
MTTTPRQRKHQYRERLYRLLLAFTLLLLASFAVPQFYWPAPICYSVIAILITRLLARKVKHHIWRERLYQWLGWAALLSLWFWVLTPSHWTYSGIPLIWSWIVFVSWSLIRLVKQLSREHQVSEMVLMGAAAGYLLLGISAGLVMNALYTFEPNSFALLDLPSQAITSNNHSVLNTPHKFAEINYFAFVCLTTVGFGGIKPILPAARMVSVTTSIVGPLYLTLMMGALISRFSSNSSSERINKESAPKDTQTSDHEVTTNKKDG